MKKTLLLTILFCFAVASFSFAQGKIAVVDIQLIMQQSKAGVKAAGELEALQKSAMSKVQAKKSEVDKLAADINKQKASLSPSALQNKNIELNKKSVELERLQNDGLAFVGNADKAVVHREINFGGGFSRVFRQILRDEPGASVRKAQIHVLNFIVAFGNTNAINDDVAVDVRMFIGKVYRHKGLNGRATSFPVVVEIDIAVESNDAVRIVFLVDVNNGVSACGQRRCGIHVEVAVDFELPF